LEATLLQDSLRYVRKNHFNKNNNNEYIGCPIHDNLLLKEKSYKIYDLPTDDELLLIILAIRDSQIKSMPWQTTKVVRHHDYSLHDKNSLYHNDNVERNIEFDIDDEDDFDVIHNIKVEDNLESMGGGLVVSNLSQQRREMMEQNEDNCHENNDNVGAYHRLKPLFDQLVSSINNIQDLEDQFDKMERNVFDLINKKRKAPVNENETTFLGEIDGPRRQEKRRKFLYEL